MSELNSAIVHDWIIDHGGAENCLQSMYSLFPSDVFTVLYDRDSVKRVGIPLSRMHETFVARLPRARKKYRSYLPLIPCAVEQFDLADYELVLSSSHAVAKGVLTHSSQLHICYCYTPMRYAWDLYQQYLREANLLRGVKSIAARMVLHYLRVWDHSSAQRVTHFVAISNYIARRIRHVYGRESTVIYPPVDVDRFTIGREDRDDFYLAASRFVPYKRMDLIVDAFTRMPDRRLVVVGDGPDVAKVRARAGRNVEMLGYQPDNVLVDLMQRARAFVFAAEEDFGIVPVEAQACGTPVIAFGRGAGRETVTEGVSGLFFDEQTVPSLQDGVRRFEAATLGPPHAIRALSLRFSRQRFEDELRGFVMQKLDEFRREQAIVG